MERKDIYYPNLELKMVSSAYDANYKELADELRAIDRANYHATGKIQRTILDPNFWKAFWAHRHIVECDDS